MKNIFKNVSNLNIGTSDKLNIICKMELRLQRTNVGLEVIKNSYTHTSNNTKQISERLIAYIRSRGYMVTQIDAQGWLGILHENDMFESLVRCIDTGLTITVTTDASPEEDKELSVFITEQMKNTGSLITTVESFDRRYNMFVTDLAYIELSVENSARDSFYPFLNVPLTKYFEEFMASRENVLIMYGPPGTGKSTFLRTLITSQYQQAMLTYSQEVIESPTLIPYFYKSKSNILAFEDIDRYLNDRTDGNATMASFLNSTEGVVLNKNKKIIFSTNLSSTNKIDPALMRRGRCFDVIKFDLLTVPQAMAIETDMGLPAQDFSSKEMWTLTEVLNPPHSFIQANGRQRVNIGFNS